MNNVSSTTDDLLSHFRGKKIKLYADDKVLKSSGHKKALVTLVTKASVFFMDKYSTLELLRLELSPQLLLSTLDHHSN